MYSPSSSPMGSGNEHRVEEMRREEAARCLHNKESFEIFYDPWNDEAPNAMSVEETLMREMRQVGLVC